MELTDVTMEEIRRAVDRLTTDRVSAGIQNPF